MKPNLKVIILCLGAGLASLPSLRADDTTPPPPANPPPGAGQPNGGGRGEGRERMQQRLIKELGLTADQQTKWQGIGQQEREAVMAVRDDTSVPQDQKRAKIQEIRKNFEAQRLAILTPDQQAKFQELRAKMRERMNQHHEGQNNPPPPPPPPPSTGTN